MVKISEEQVYGALSYEWQQVLEIRDNIEQELGLNDLSFYKKLFYLVSFQSSYVSVVDVHTKINNLRREGLAEIDDRDEDVEGEILKARYVRKKGGGFKEKEERFIPSGLLERGLGFTS